MGMSHAAGVWISGSDLEVRELEQLVLEACADFEELPVLKERKGGNLQRAIDEQLADGFVES